MGTPFEDEVEGASTRYKRQCFESYCAQNGIEPTDANFGLFKAGVKTACDLLKTYLPSAVAEYLPRTRAIRIVQKESPGWSNFWGLLG